MNVLIKGFEVPKDGCKDCAMVQRGKVFDICPFLKQEVNGNVERGGKPNGCPLIEVPDKNVGDMISRQAALDAIDEIESEVADGYGYQYEKWRKYFCELPSAQPERKKLPPIYKRGTDVVHVSYADGRSGFESHKWAEWVCQECGWFVGEQYVPGRHNQNRANFCARCGCEIDWENAKEGEDETD